MEQRAPFVIPLSSLDQGKSIRETVGSASDLGIDPAQVTVEGPVVLHATLYRQGLRVEIQGGLTTSLRMNCDRCLEPVRVRIEVPLRVYAERRESRDRRPEEEVREDDLGMIYHDTQRIDLTDEVRQELLVQVPWHVLCRPDCRGLCAGCGIDLNREVCGCSARAPGRAT